MLNSGSYLRDALTLRTLLTFCNGNSLWTIPLRIPLNVFMTKELLLLTQNLLNKQVLLILYVSARVLHTAAEQDSRFQLRMRIPFEFSFKSNVLRIKVSGITEISLCFVVLWAKLIPTLIIDLAWMRTRFPYVISPYHSRSASQPLPFPLTWNDFRIEVIM